MRDVAPGSESRLRVESDKRSSILSFPAAAKRADRESKPWRFTRFPIGRFAAVGNDRAAYLPSALSVIAVVKAPVGSFEMTGSEPPVSSVFTVRS